MPMRDVAYRSVARTSSPPAKLLLNDKDAQGAHILVYVTAFSGTPSVAFNFTVKDPASEQRYPILEGQAVAPTDNPGDLGFYIYKIHPGVTPVAGNVAADAIPREWYIEPVHADGDSITYSVGVVYLA